MRNHLSSSNSTTLTSPTLSRAQVGITASNLLRLLHNLLALGQDQLDVAGVRHVWVDLELQVSRRPGEGWVEGVLRDREHGMFVDAAWGPG